MDRIRLAECDSRWLACLQLWIFAHAQYTTRNCGALVTSTANASIRIYQKWRKVMKSVVLLIVCVIAVVTAPSPKFFEEGVIASPCSEEECKIEDGCRCSSAQSPLSLEETPQLISLTFEEPITDDLYTDFLMDLIFPYLNPDGRQIGATFYVPHENTDYQRIRDLYILGFEIGVHSITNNNSDEYWHSASEELLEQEFGGQKQIISKFANIPAEAIKGVRTPKLQLAANASIQAFINSNLSYDNSWVTSADDPLFPYTLDYLSTEECPNGNLCPNEAFPKFWINPIIKFKLGDEECIPLANCNYTGNSTETSLWILSEIDRVRNSTKTPITLSVKTDWFLMVEDGKEAFRFFMNALETYSDTFLVSQTQLVDWLMNPLPLANFTTDFSMKDATCEEIFCDLLHGEENRTMSSCDPCPEVYPWLGNPEGKAT